MDYGVYGDLTMTYPEPCSIYLRGDYSASLFGSGKLNNVECISSQKLAVLASISSYGTVPSLHPRSIDRDCCHRIFLLLKRPASYGKAHR